jgi:hypothetical protein
VVPKWIERFLYALLCCDEVVVLKIVAQVKRLLDFGFYEDKSVLGKFRPGSTDVLVTADVMLLQHFDGVVE